MLFPTGICYEDYNKKIINEHELELIVESNNFINQLENKFYFETFFDLIFRIFDRLPTLETLLENIFERFLSITNGITKDDSYQGYTLFSPEYSRYTYLMNNNGWIIHRWKSENLQGLGSYLSETGVLYRLDLPYPNPTFFAGGIAGRVATFDKESNLLWEFIYSDNEHCSHHDIEVLPNGNVLLIAWETKTRDEAIEAGRDPDKLKSNSLWPDHIIEVEPTGPSSGDIVWEWHLWDHLIQDFDPSKDNYGIVEDHSELIDINYGNTRQDWTHTNSIDYNEEFNQILISVLEFNEIWVIDHSTSIEEAANHSGGNSGKGGDILYRWGNPSAYGAGSSTDKKFYGQHGARWVKSGCPGEGNIIIFNNGNGRPDGRYSTIDEIVPPVDSNGNYNYTPGLAYEPEEQIWIYVSQDPNDLYSTVLSSVQRLPNGNTLICSAMQGLFLEITYEKKIVWKYKNILPSLINNAVAKIERYPLDYPGIRKTININHNGKSIDDFTNKIKFEFQ